MKIDIRPKFDEAVMSADLPTRKAVAKALKLLQSFTDVSQLWNHHGLNFEKLHGFIEPTTSEQLDSIRVTQSARAITCLLNGPTIILVTLYTEHDKAYRRK